jgi:hypothetical protein
MDKQPRVGIPHEAIEKKDILLFPKRAYSCSRNNGISKKSMMHGE